MTARIKELEDLNHLRQFVFCTPSAAHAAWLNTALRELGVSTQEQGDANSIARTLNMLRPAVAFIDFSGDAIETGDGADAANPDLNPDLKPDLTAATNPGVSALARASELARMLARLRPDLPLVAVGRSNNMEGALTAFRSGVRDFVDLTASDAEILSVVQRVSLPLEMPAPPAAQGRRLVLLGTRVGMGVTTLATHMAALAARGGFVAKAAASHANGAAPSQADSRVALLDLGLPAGDGLLYLNEASTFHFAEAVRNLQRFDQTLVQTALTHSSYGATVISLPRDLAEMRMVTHADSLALMNQLRLYFDFLITDLNGSANFEFIAKMVQEADETWVVTDQSIGSIVSLADLLGELAQKKVGPERLRLVVNRYDERYGMAAEQIAERFSLQLAGTIPDRALALLRSANLGQLLVKTAEQDPYVRAVRGLVEQLRQPDPAARKSSATKLGLGGLSKLFASR